MIDISERNSAESGGRGTQYSFVVDNALRMVGARLPVDELPYNLGVYYKKDGEWHYYDKYHKDGVRAIRETFNYSQ